ncbi:hypothetical protein [Streptomyces sp. NPDC048603]
MAGGNGSADVADECADLAWTNVKAHYRLTVTEGEKTKLSEMLGTCPS